ncbi:GNAT family N-acetyltransferase [uncultured Sanguibacteroides sp.]|uniref:GNAT family N-acetyltransferase n=1 Tax=uncultured Sanguibacteroides sp. TaxID=1635151 RepID=UPI0025DBB2E7|nr:GNAT family N-acetyltransferase [uncultured Sanguibacteroides sp.]
MQPVIYPVEKAKLIAELTEDKFVRKTNKGGNEIYSLNAHDAPHIMREIGRLRELTFRTAGGGTGKAVDIDEFDTNESTPYQQLIVWDPKECEILGGYRYILCDNLPLNAEGEPNLATTELFRLSEKFKKEYLTKMIELGRSFVQPLYQSTKMGRKSLFALDNLWDGLGALTVENPEMKYFFGKVTMYTSFNREARDLILYFMKKYFRDRERLVEPIHPLEIHIDEKKFSQILNGANYEENYKILSKCVREHGENIPPLVNAYMSLSPSMRTFGTAINPTFGGVEETAIIIKIEDVYETKKARHVSTYIPRILRLRRF